MPESLPLLRWRGLWLVVAWCLWMVVMTLSLMSAPPMPDFRFADKVSHLLAYGALMFCFGQLYARRWRVALLLSVMGVGVEFLQGLVGRWFDVYDMLANALGVVSLWVLLVLTPLGRTLSWLESRLAR